MLRNENLSSAMGELPPIECWPELWILNAYDEALARQLVKDFQTQSARPAGPSWQCKVCGEQVEGNFELCWNCQSDRPIDDGANGIIDQT